MVRERVGPCLLDVCVIICAVYVNRAVICGNLIKKQLEVH